MNVEALKWKVKYIKSRWNRSQHKRPPHQFEPKHQWIYLMAYESPWSGQSHTVPVPVFHLVRQVLMEMKARRPHGEVFDVAERLRDECVF
jgi:hypothetical protein